MTIKQYQSCLHGNIQYTFGYILGVTLSYFVRNLSGTQWLVASGLSASEAELRDFPWLGPVDFADVECKLKSWPIGMRSTLTKLNYVWLLIARFEWCMRPIKDPFESPKWTEAKHYESMSLWTFMYCSFVKTHQAFLKTGIRHSGHPVQGTVWV